MGTAFDAWYPGYVDYAPNFKNIAAFWTETALFQYATPHDYTLDEFPQNMRDLRPQSLYSSPWPPGRWRLRDAVGDMSHWNEFDYVVVNDDFDRAVDDLTRIVDSQAEQLRADRPALTPLIAELLA